MKLLWTLDEILSFTCRRVVANFCTHAVWYRRRTIANELAGIAMDPPVAIRVAKYMKHKTEIAYTRLDDSLISHHTGATSSVLSLHIIELIPRHVQSTASQTIYTRMAVDQELNRHGSNSSTKTAQRKLATGTRGKVGSMGHEHVEYRPPQVMRSTHVLRSPVFKGNHHGRNYALRTHT